MIVDAVGAAQMDRKLVHKMRDAGVHVCFFRPPKPYAVRRLQYRNHRKLLIVDGTTGFTGGVGIAEEWTGNAQDPDHWRDTHVRVTGPVVRGLQGAFAENWLECTGDVLAGDRYLPNIEAIEDGGPMQVMRSSATVGDSNAEALIYLAVAAAKRSIELTSAYFVPRPPSRRRSWRPRSAASHAHPRPGSHIDKQFVRTAGRAAYDQLIDAGIEIYEYCPTMLHAKTLTVDEMLVVGRLGELRQPLLPAPRRGHALRAERALRRPAARGVREGPRGIRADRADEWRERPITQRARENVTKYARREL